MHQSSYRNMEGFVKSHLQDKLGRPLRIIDIGSQDINGSYKPIFQHPYWEYEGADVVEGNNVDIVLRDMYDWRGLRSNHYDVVISGQAFEHIEYFWITMMEIARVMKVGGLCCIIAPSSGNEHRYPVDCWRFFSDGMKALARYAGLQTIDAYTQHNEDLYPDYDPVWKDSVLICRKPGLTLSRRIAFHIKDRLIVRAR